MIPETLAEKLEQLDERLYGMMSWDWQASLLYMTHHGEKYTYIERDYYISTETTRMIMTSNVFDYDLFWMLINTLDVHPTYAIAASLS